MLNKALINNVFVIDKTMTMTWDRIEQIIQTIINMRNTLLSMDKTTPTGSIIKENKQLETHGVDNDIDTSLHSGATWGPWVFRFSMVATLVFMWWLVIYDHGVISHH
jgi:hypothetical protein